VKGPKSDDFSLLVKTMDVQLGLERCADGLLEIHNTEKRI
jgi:hypothetical protein